MVITNGVAIVRSRRSTVGGRMGGLRRFRIKLMEARTRDDIHARVASFSLL